MSPGKIEEAKEILRELGLPSAQQNDISALTLLALCGIGPDDAWRKARRESLTVTKGIMDFIKQRHSRAYAPNTRETVRRQVLHQFVQAGVADYNPDDPSLPTNSPRAHYAVSDGALDVIRRYGSRRWKSSCMEFVREKGSLAEVYRSRRSAKMVPITLRNGEVVNLSPGKHNELQAAIIQEFAPRFAPGAVLPYFGDTAKKRLIVDKTGLSGLGVAISEHDKLPDIVLFDPKRKWVFLIEAVTSHGAVSPKRVLELRKMFSRCSCGVVFVSAFPDFGEFRKHLRDIAWETEVWIAEIPDHLIHYNGDRFLGPG